MEMIFCIDIPCTVEWRILECCETEDEERDFYFGRHDLRVITCIMTRTRAKNYGTKKETKMEKRTKSTKKETKSTVDPVYKMFLDHLRLDGTAYIFEMVDKDTNEPLYVKYEAGEDVSEKSKSKSKSKSNSPQKSKSPKKTKPSKTVEPPKIIKPSKKSKKIKPSKKSRPPVTESRKRTKRVEILEEDESYERFLNNMTIKDGYMVLHLESEGRFVYEQEEEEEEEDSDDGENLVQESRSIVPYFNPFTSNEEKSDDNSLLTFEEKLNAVLSGPYDQFEYEALMDEATHRKPLMKQRNLRHMSKRYSTRECGLSYLDHYPDLGIQISRASNNYDRLILLRKFFFWLENLCHEGAYMPWVPKALMEKPIFDEEHENINMLPIAMVRDLDEET